MFLLLLSSLITSREGDFPYEKQTLLEEWGHTSHTIRILFLSLLYLISFTIYSYHLSFFFCHLLPCTHAKTLMSSFFFFFFFISSYAIITTTCIKNYSFKHFSQHNICGKFKFDDLFIYFFTVSTFFLSHHAMSTSTIFFTTFL